MIASIHQPDLLPYSGFWFKMSASDVFVVAVHDQFQKHGYQRRVMMRGAWCSHRLIGKPSLVPIKEVEVAPNWQSHLVDVIRGRYTGARYWSTRGTELVDRILSCTGTQLDEVNIALIEHVRDLLGIQTPLVVTAPPTSGSVGRLIEQLQMVGATEYLAGPGGRSYMGDDAEQRFAAAGVRLTWSRHAPLTGDSIVSVLMDEPDPLGVVTAAD